MLILTRRITESVMIGTVVKVTILGWQGGQVRIGIEAPPEVEVHREEVFKRIWSERRAKTIEKSQGGAKPDTPPPVD